MKSNVLLYARATQRYYVNDFSKDGFIKSSECIVPRLGKASEPRKRVRHYSSKVKSYFDASLIDMKVSV